MKEEALKLADYVEAREINNPHLKEASAMIRRLVEELDKATYVLHPKIRNTEAEEVYDDLCMSWQADMENGVKWLNEKAVEDFKKKYPELNKSISRTMQFLWAIAEGGEAQTKPLSDGEIDESFDRTASHMANEYVSHYEPAAWINHIKQTGGDFYDLNVSGRGEPLYRHPPQTKRLSDEEIKQIYEKIYEESHDNQVLALARAIEERHGIK